ncbi:carboxypeptidase regulatory-like domain-containing protein [Candidatus Riflebacteria bacterium]
MKKDAELFPKQYLPERSFLALFIFLIVTFFLFIGCGGRTNLNGTLNGQVVDATTGQGIEGAVVSTNPATQTVISTANGFFEVPDVTPGIYTISATKTDYNQNNLTVTIDGGFTANVNLVLISQGGSFSQHVFPIISATCSLAGCHDETTAAGGLRTTSYRNLLRGGRRGAVIYPYDALSSPLVKYINGTLTPRMPLNLPPLSTTDQGKVIDWVNAGSKNN